MGILYELIRHVFMYVCVCTYGRDLATGEIEIEGAASPRLRRSFWRCASTCNILYIRAAARKDGSSLLSDTDRAERHVRLGLNAASDRLPPLAAI